MIINSGNLNSLAMGAAFLSAGGGSFPYLEYLQAKELLAARHGIPLISSERLADNAKVAVVCMVGAPLVMLERLVDTEHFAQAARGLARHLDCKFDAVMGLEIGCLNSMIPVLVATTLGLPIVDADTFGRSFPQINMSTFAINGSTMSPLVLSDIRENEIIVSKAANGDWAEALMRPVTTALGAVAGLAISASGKLIKEHAIQRTYSRAISIGESILSAQRTHRDVVGCLLEENNGCEIVRGRICDIERRIEGGFVWGEATVAPSDGSTAVKVMFQNEYAVVQRDQQIISTVPDLICLMDTVRGEPIGSESLRYAQQVSVISLPAMMEHMSPKAMAAVGPRAFGYDFEHHSPHTKVGLK